MIIKEIINEVYDILNEDATLAFVCSAGGISIGKDIDKLLQGKHPWIMIDIDPDTLKIEDADNIRAYDVVREIYKINIVLSVAHKDKYTSIYGTSTFQGLLDLNKLVWDILSDNPMLNDVVDGIYGDVSLETDVLEPFGDGLLYKAGARMSIAYFKDNQKR